MPESLGTRLRQHRERQRVALATIAEQTKIGVSLLEELERDDLSHWPGGIFRRAFVRDYARAIGLDPEPVVREVLECHPDPADCSFSALASLSQGAPIESRTEPPEPPDARTGHGDGFLTRARRRLTSRPDSVTESPAARLVVPGVAEIPVALDWPAVAQLCTRLSRTDHLGDAASVLPEAANTLRAVGLVVWVWDAELAGLRPVLVHGYPDEVVRRLPNVHPEADHATAQAFRSGQWCSVGATDRSTGALVVPLLTPAGCAGVLAYEFPPGSTQTESKRAAALILAAQFARIVGMSRSASASDPDHLEPAHAPTGTGEPHAI